MSHRSLLAGNPRRIVAALAVVAATQIGCRKIPPPPPPAPPEPAALTKPEPAQPSAATPSAEPAPATEQPYFKGPGWSELRIQDELPICVFSSWQERDKAAFIDQVKKQTLAAGATVVFGVYPPFCLNQECDALPNLQCWVDREANTLTVHTRFFSFHKADAACKTGCMDVDTSCETPALEAGQYTVRHGAKTYTLKIPSSPRSPCFDSK